MKPHEIQHEFVEQFPDHPVDGTVYVSIFFATAMHRCCCGCGNQVITPLAPNAWRLIFDGKISLEPSIGNWSFPCQSHYWISRNKVEWARRWSRDEIATGRTRDRRALERNDAPTDTKAGRAASRKELRKRWWEKLTMWF